MTEHLAFNMQSNEVVMSCELDVDCQEVSSQTPSRTAQQQRTNTLVPLQKRERQRESTEYADVFTREGEEFGSTSTMHH